MPNCMTNLICQLVLGVQSDYFDLCTKIYVNCYMYNELRKLCLGCEAIVCGEREDAYRFMVKFQVMFTQWLVMDSSTKK